MLNGIKDKEVVRFLQVQKYYFLEIMELVENIERLSVSQIKAFQRNPFYWALSYIAKLPQGESAALKYGKEIHAEIERLLTNSFAKPTTDAKTQEKAWLLVTKLRELCNLDNFGIDVEKEFIQKIAEDLPPFKGIIDLYIPFYTYDNERRTPAILDHKTVKNEKFALDEQDLENDFQLSLYAFFVGNHPVTFVQHNQIFKESDEIRFIYTTLSREKVSENLKKICEIAREMMSYHKKIIEFGLFSQETFCKERCQKTCKYMYGRCPYSEICEGKVTIEQYLKKMEGEKMTEEKPKWLVESTQAADLSIMMNEAREFYEKKGYANKFELREAIAQGITYGLRKHDIKAVILTQFLLHSNDPDYMPVITRIKEYGAKIFIEIK